MLFFIDCANDNEGILNLVFAAAVAIAAVVSARLNQRLVGETMVLRKAEPDPDIAL